MYSEAKLSRAAKNTEQTEEDTLNSEIRYTAWIIEALR